MSPHEKNVKNKKSKALRQDSHRDSKKSQDDQKDAEEATGKESDAKSSFIL